MCKLFLWRSDWKHPKVCVNLQTDVRQITQFGGFIYGTKKKIRRKRAIVRKRQTTRPGELVFMRHSK